MAPASVAIMSFTCSEAVADLLHRASCDPRAVSTPAETLRSLSLISDPISFVEAALRSASLLTSSATTANPRPCSPARAASMAAFSARRFVWRRCRR